MARAGAGRPDRPQQGKRQSPPRQGESRPERQRGRPPGPPAQHKGKDRPRRDSRPDNPPRRARRERPPERLSTLLAPRGGTIELLYGRNAVLEALRAGRRRAYTLAVAAGARAEGSLGVILSLAKERGLPVREVERQELDLLAAGHQGVALEASPYPYEDLDTLIARSGPGALYLLLDLIEDPQNLGTLLRTADVVGVAGVVIPAHRAAGVTPAVSNASAGAVEYLPVSQVANLVQAMASLREAGVWLAGLEDVPEAQPYDQADWLGPMALVVGSEGRGMRRLVRERCDFLVRLPMAGHVSSLNAAVAGSIVLYHAWRRRGSEGHQ